MILNAKAGLGYDVFMTREDDIVRACRRGDTRDFGELYEEYADPIYRFLFYRTFDKELAEDLTSETFVKVIKKIDSFDPARGSFSSWIYRIARNTLIDHVRVEKHDVNLDEIVEMGIDERYGEKMDMKDAAQEVLKHLKSFSPEQQEIVKLRVWDELSYREISEILGKSEGACKTAFSRAISKLQDQVTLPVLLLGMGFLSRLMGYVK